MRKLLMVFLLMGLVPACDPVFTICVEVTACDDGEPIVGARVSIPHYDATMFTEPNGVACYSDVGELGRKLTIEVEKPGYPSQEVVVDPPDGPGSFDTDVCLDPE